LTQTDPGGTIVILDTAAYGGVTITQSVTIEAVPGAQGLIKVQPSTTGISITGGALVVLRGLLIEGFNAASTIGINQNGGNSNVVVEDCKLTQLTTAITVTGSLGSIAKMDLINSDVLHNGTGIIVTGKGTNFSGNPIVAAEGMVLINAGNILYNTTGISSVNQGTGPMNSSLINVGFFAPGQSVPLVNLIRNTNQIVCSGTANCINQPVRYDWQSAIAP